MTFPKNIIYLDEISEFDSTLKDGYFQIKLKNGTNLNLKSEDNSETLKWIDCFIKLMVVYADKRLFDFEFERKWKEEVDQRVTNEIMEELERKILPLT